eukprot:s1515_g12.t1
MDLEKALRHRRLSHPRTHHTRCFMARAQKRPAAAAARSARREIAGSSGEQREEVKVIEISHEETSEDAAPSEGYCCYVLRSDNSARARTYTGITTDLKRRLRQHNGELRGGARATRRGGPWRVLCMVKGFPTKEDAARFEWRAKRQRAASSRKLVPLKGGLHRRCQNLCDVLRAERWTKSSRPARELPLAVTWFGGAPWQRVVLPSYISAQCLEGDFQPGSSNKRRKRSISKDARREKSVFCSSTFAGRVSERASLGNSRRNGFQLKKQCWHQ